MVNISLTKISNTPISYINGSILPASFNIDPDGYVGTITINTVLTPLNNDNVANVTKTTVYTIEEDKPFKFNTEQLSTQVDTLYKLYIVVNINGKSVTSPYYLINTNTGGEIIIKHDQVFSSPVRGINLILDHIIEGNPNIQVFVSNVPSDNDNYNEIEWFDITNDVLVDGTSIIFDNMQELRDSGKNEFPLYIKIHVSKSSNDDNYKFFGYMISIINDCFYKEY